jgi:hypothetical protein
MANNYRENPVIPGEITQGEKLLDTCPISGDISSQPNPET